MQRTRKPPPPTALIGARNPPLPTDRPSYDPGKPVPGRGNPENVVSLDKILEDLLLYSLASVVLSFFILWGWFVHCRERPRSPQRLCEIYVRFAKSLSSA